MGVVVDGESSVRGMELITRSEASGRCFIIFGGGGCEALSEDVDGREDGGWGAFLPASSHAARAEGSTGQADDERFCEGGEELLDEVFPILFTLSNIEWRMMEDEAQIEALQRSEPSCHCGKNLHNAM